MKARFDAVGIKPGDIKSREDYPKRVPVLTKEDFLEFTAGCNFDMERVLTYDRVFKPKAMLCTPSFVERM